MLLLVKWLDLIQRSEEQPERALRDSLRLHPAPAASARAHYNRYPYDVGTGGGDVYVTHAGILGRFLRSVEGGVAVDLGCGPGNLLPTLGARAGVAVGLDISERSTGLARCAGLAQGGRADSVVQADLLRLPLRDGSVDVAVATGSLHHTGDAGGGFAELCRVLRPGGRAFVSLYRRASYYDAVYGTVGRIARGCARLRATDLVVNRLVLLPAFWLYFVAGRLAAHRRIRLPASDEVRNYFADQLLNPVVSFHREAEVRRWAAAGRLEIDELATTHAGALLNVVAHKAHKTERL